MNRCFSLAILLALLPCFAIASGSANHADYSAFAPIADNTESMCSEVDSDIRPNDIITKADQQNLHWEYAFENRPDLDKWYWISFPVLDTLTVHAQRAFNVFKALRHTHYDDSLSLTPTYLDGIWWLDQGFMNTIQWSMHDWNPNLHSHGVTSSQGYKIRIRPRVSSKHPSIVSMQIKGQKAPDNLEFPIYGGTQNWLGYFLEESQMPEKALGAIWDDVLVVKTKNWSLIRDADSGEMHGKSNPLNFGDMLVLVTRNNHRFRWGRHSHDDPIRKTDPEFFIFDEKQDYVPLYINIPQSLQNELKEIGLYSLGMCKGAVVVDDELEQIPVYIDNLKELTQSKVDLVFYFSEPRAGGHKLGILTINSDRLQANYGAAGARYPYFEVIITQDDMNGIVAPEFSLKQNYPNPFNPTTTITYSLPEATKMRLDIYNLKGQLVKTLVNDEVSAGLHSVVWNSKDMNNAAVASGVYFYRISSPNKTQTRKMLLMK